jgi:hypothetical protein
MTQPNQSTKSNLTPFLFILAGFLLFGGMYALICLKDSTTPEINPEQSQIDSLQSVINNQNVIISEKDVKIDSISAQKQKTDTIIKEVPRIIDRWNFHETTNGMIGVFGAVELLPTEIDTLICLTEKQAKQAVTTDTLMKLYKIQLVRSDSIIDWQGVQLSAKDTIILSKDGQLGYIRKALNECQTGLKRQRLSTRIWQGVCLLLGVGLVVK